jgi:multidrug efflux pump subunit AcrA (membrane-fusion protein)
MKCCHLLILFCLASHLSLGVAQEPPLIRLGPEQARAAGIAYARVEDAAAAGDTLRLSGNAAFSARGMEIVSAPAAGVVQDVLVAPMQKLAAGAPLVRLHSPQFLEWQREYVQLSTQEKLAADKLARDEALYRDGIIALSRLQDTRNAHVQARVAARERAQLLRLAGMNEAGLRALASRQAISPALPVGGRSAGTVLELIAMPGQHVEAGAPLAKVARSGELVLELQATRAQADQIKPGDAVEVAGCAKPGRVTALSPQMNAASQSVLVRAELPAAEQCLRPNQYLDATIRTRGGPAGGFAVPSTALLRFDNRDYVLVREPAGLRPVPVTLAARGPERSVVAGKLTAGSEVAVRGIVALKGMWMGLGSQNESK